LKKRALFTIPISILLIAVMITSFFLMNIKPDASKVPEDQKLSDYTKPAVVRILNYAYVGWEYHGTNSNVGEYLRRLGNETLMLGSGSGAIISSDGYIVTNAHVVEYSKMEDVTLATNALQLMASEVSEIYGYGYDETYNYMVENVLYSGVEKGLKVVLPGGEMLDGEIKSYGSSANNDEGKDVAVVKIEGRNLPTLFLGDSHEIQNQETIWVIGYPAAAESDILSPDSSLVSTMNDGKISATTKKTETGSPVIQLNAAATHGNSGGPVINDKGEIIGLLTFRGNTVNGQEVQGFNFAVPVNTVREYVAQSGASMKKSESDTIYKEGLALFWGGYYKNALDKFEAVERLYPTHSEIKRYIAESEEKMNKSKTLWSDYKMAFYITDGVAGLLILILMLFTFVIKPKQAKLAVATTPVQTFVHDQLQPAQPTTTESVVADLNNDGKIDIQDILLALQEHQKKENKDE
jgi:serine protease Do